MDYYINMVTDLLASLQIQDLHTCNQVAQHLGYESQYYFSGPLKKGTGVPENIRKYPRIPADFHGFYTGWELNLEDLTAACNSSVRKNSCSATKDMDD